MRTAASAAQCNTGHQARGEFPELFREPSREIAFGDLPRLGIRFGRIAKSLAERDDSDVLARQSHPIRRYRSCCGGEGTAHPIDDRCQTGLPRIDRDDPEPPSLCRIILI